MSSEVKLSSKARISCAPKLQSFYFPQDVRYLKSCIDFVCSYRVISIKLPCSSDRIYYISYSAMVALCQLNEYTQLLRKEWNLNVLTCGPEYPTSPFCPGVPTSPEIPWKE